MTADEFIAREEQKHIELMWSGRNVFRAADREWLQELGVEYGEPCGLELNCSYEIAERAAITMEKKGL